MKIQFSGQQHYQIDAVGAVIDVFDGQPLAGGKAYAFLDTTHEVKPIQPLRKLGSLV